MKGPRGKPRRMRFVDVTLRDAHQCLWSTRMTAEMMAPVLATIDRAGFDIVNILGGAVFDVAVRFLHENPWRRVQMLCERLETPCDALTRGQSLYTFELFPDDVVELNAHVLARLGIKVFTIYDALNDNRNLESSFRAGREAGMRISAWMTYTLSPVHDDAYYAARAKELVGMGADYLCIKDPSGLLTPERGRTLFPAVMAAGGGVPLQLHSHCQSGLAPEVYTEAMKAGFEYAYTALDPLGNGASLPSTQEIAARARRLGLDVALDDQAMGEASAYFDWLCASEGKPRGKVAQYDPALYEHQIPGGMISNLRSQLEGMGIGHRLQEIMEEAARVRRDLGYPILVSPFAQYIITQAMLNVVQGERYRTVPDEVRRYASGGYGRIAAPMAPEFLERAAIRDAERVTGRAAEHVEPWLPRLRARLGAGTSDEQLLLHAFYDDAMVAQLRDPIPDCRFRTTPMEELVRHLASRRDIARARIRFAGVDLSFSA